MGTRELKILKTFEGHLSTDALEALYLADQEYERNMEYEIFLSKLNVYDTPFCKVEENLTGAQDVDYSGMSEPSEKYD